MQTGVPITKEGGNEMTLDEIEQGVPKVHRVFYADSIIDSMEEFYKPTPVFPLSTVFSASENGKNGSVHGRPVKTVVFSFPTNSKEMPERAKTIHLTLFNKQGDQLIPREELDVYLTAPPKHKVLIVKDGGIRVRASYEKACFLMDFFAKNFLSDFCPAPDLSLFDNIKILKELPGLFGCCAQFSTLEAFDNVLNSCALNVNGRSGEEIFGVDDRMLWAAQELTPETLKDYRSFSQKHQSNIGRLIALWNTYKNKLHANTEFENSVFSGFVKAAAFILEAGYDWDMVCKTVLQRQSDIQFLSFVLGAMKDAGLLGPISPLQAPSSISPIIMAENAMFGPILTGSFIPESDGSDEVHYNGYIIRPYRNRKEFAIDLLSFDKSYILPHNFVCIRKGFVPDRPYGVVFFGPDMVNIQIFSGNDIPSKLRDFCMSKEFFDLPFIKQILAANKGGE